MNSSVNFFLPTVCEKDHCSFLALAYREVDVRAVGRTRRRKETDIWNASSLSWGRLHWSTLLPSRELSFLWDLKNQQLWNWLLTDFNWDGPKLKISEIKSLDAYSTRWCVNFFIAFPVYLFLPDMQKICSPLQNIAMSIIGLFWNSEAFWPHYIGVISRYFFSSHLNFMLFIIIWYLEVSHPRKGLLSVYLNILKMVIIYA